MKVSLILLSLMSTAGVFTQTTIDVKGSFRGHEDVSAVEIWKSSIVMASDERGEIVLLARKSGDAVEVRFPIQLTEDPDEELDIEAMASRGEDLYVLGSHSRRRRRSDRSDRKYARNRERLRETPHDEERDTLIWLTPSAEGSAPLHVRASLNLRPWLQADPYLKSGEKVPGKENGVDIEGLAVVDDGTLFLGFRGPVLRGGFTPVMKLQFSDPSDYELSFVRLGGRGIRSLATVDDGFLVLGGPVGDSALSYQLYFWNGLDCVPGKGSPDCQLKILTVIQPPTPGARPEGMTVLSESSTAYELLMVHDGVGYGRPMKLVVPKDGSGIDS